MRIYYVSGVEGKRTFLIVTDERDRALELAGIFAQSGSYDRVEIGVDGKTYVHPNFKEMK